MSRRASPRDGGEYARQAGPLCRRMAVAGTCRFRPARRSLQAGLAESPARRPGDQLLCQSARYASRSAPAKTGRRGRAAGGKLLSELVPVGRPVEKPVGVERFRVIRRRDRRLGVGWVARLRARDRVDSSPPRRRKKMTLTKGAACQVPDAPSVFPDDWGAGRQGRASAPRPSPSVGRAPYVGSAAYKLSGSSTAA